MIRFPVPGWTFWIALMMGVASFCLRWISFSGSEFAPGWDGYFYLIQVKAMVEEGSMHSADSSPVYLILKGLYAICGDYETAFQLMCALLAGLFSALSFWAARQISGSTPTALVVGAWTVFSPSLTFFAAQFPKNLLGMNALLLLLGFSLRRTAWPKALALLLAFWSHRMTAGLSLIFWVARKLTWQRMLGVAALGAIGVAVALMVPGLLRPADLERFSGAFQATPQLQGWAFIQLLEPERMHLSWMAEIGIAFFFLAYWLLTWITDRPTQFGVAFFALVLVLIFPFFRMEVQGMGYRFFLSFMLLAPLVFALIPHILPKFFFHLVATGFLVLSLWGRAAYQPEVFDPDYAQYSALAEKIESELSKAKPELLIAHKGLAEMITFRTGIDALPWQPEYDVDSLRLWRISAEIMPMEFRYFLSKEDQKRVIPLGIDCLTLPETVWQRFVRAAEEDGDEDLLVRIQSWRNPHEERPAYLRK
jgi:hypothetical protein